MAEMSLDQQAEVLKIATDKKALQLAPVPMVIPEGQHLIPFGGIDPMIRLNVQPDILQVFTTPDGGVTQKLIFEVQRRRMPMGEAYLWHVDNSTIMNETVSALVARTLVDFVTHKIP